ncbi:hypothetical protein ACJIZ3_001005 [Penstemon smallii]|uniref:Uncharacterized protein n=1 Tax=Penstemon smallii TaxID=265156 RepID=A0ABD3U2H1_9LAMI
MEVSSGDFVGFRFWSKELPDSSKSAWSFASMEVCLTMRALCLDLGDPNLIKWKREEEVGNCEIIIIYIYIVAVVVVVQKSLIVDEWSHFYF